MSESKQAAPYADDPVSRQGGVAEISPEEELGQSDSGRMATSLVVRSRLANYGIIITSIIAILAGIYFARGVLTPLFIAAFFAVILYAPLSFMCDKMHLPRYLAIPVLAAGVFLIGAAIVMILTTQLWQFKNDLPRYWMSFNQTMVSHNIDPNELLEAIPFHERIIQFLERKDADESDESDESAHAVPSLPPAAAPETETASSGQDPLLAENPSPNKETGPGTALVPLPDLSPDDVDEEGNILPPANLSEAPKRIFLANMNQLYNYVSEFLGRVMSFISTIFLVVLLLIFMLFEVKNIPEKIAAAISVQENERVRNVLVLIRKYMTVKFCVSFFVGVSVTVLLNYTHVQYSVLWGVLAFFLNFIPNIGSIVAAIPPIIIAIADQGLGIGLGVTLGFIAINFVFGYWVEPLWLGNGLDVSPLVVLISLIIWGALLGPVGMFLSPPLAVICKIILMQFDETKWLAILMANKAPPAVKETAAE